jgi:hypothetical protein
MDTKEAAKQVGTTPRVFRVFLRSPISTFVAVGSGARYEFTEDEMPMLKKRFAEWRMQSKVKGGSPAKRPAPRETVITPRVPRKPSQQDLEVWQEEGPVVLEDIRNPAVRARVLADARAAENRLMMALLAAGMHVSQQARRVAA